MKTYIKPMKTYEYPMKTNSFHSKGFSRHTKCVENQATGYFPEMCFLVWKLFPHPVGVFCELLEAPNCHTQQNQRL